MAITKTTIYMRGFPKPRGGLNRAGKMTHSKNGYRNWQKQYIDYLESIAFTVKDKRVFCLATCFNIIKKPGQQPDASNYLGGIEDVLVKGKFIIDDNYQYVPRVYSQIMVSSVDRINCFIIETKEDFHHFFDNVDELNT